MDHETASLLGVIITQLLATVVIITGQILSYKYNRRKFHESHKEIAASKFEILDANGKNCRYGQPPDPTTNPETHQ